MKKIISLQVILGACVFLISLLHASLDAIEEPPYKGQSTFFIASIVLHLIYFVPILIYLLIKKKFKTLFQSFLILTLYMLLPIMSKFSHKNFDSAKWKKSVDEVTPNYTSRKIIPYYREGKMAQNIIESSVLINKTKREIEELLGEPTEIWGNEYIYSYANGSFFDGCSEVTVSFTDTICIAANFGSCD